MKKLIYLLCLIVLGITSAGAQPKLTTFNLDFPGGTPADLVQAVEKATGKPLNAIIPTEDADTQLPPLKMNNVVVPRLFAALEAASQHTVAVSVGHFVGSYTENQIGYGFRTSDNPVTDSSIWFFYVTKPTLPPVIVSPVVSTESICKFYQLQGYLDRGFTVDDITTAIQTGWKMAGISPVPELNYHKETKLLIAFGKPDDLATIQNVLDALPQSNLGRNEAEVVLRQVDKIATLESQVKQLNEEVTLLTAKSSEKSSGK